MKHGIRFVLVTALVAGLLVGLGKVVRISPDWPLWAVALGVALVVEVLLGLYRYECGAVTATRARWMIGLRMASLAVLVWILIEPTWVRKVSKEFQREVVVLLDDSASMHLTDDGASASRLELGEKALADAGIVKELGETMRVRTLRAARSIRGDDEQVDEGWGLSTDLASALDTVLEQVPPDELAGVVLVSDGRHNRPARVEEVARRFGILDAPIGVLAVGSAEPPRDAAVLSVRAPEAVHLGDRMRVSAEVKFDGYKGKKALVRLTRGGETLEEREVQIPQDRHREELRFAQVPESGGVGDFRVSIEALEGERFSDNNDWGFETSITDARTNVLLVDGHPRWEFRYLRNLFYGRDKSVHLQWVLMHPDRIAGEDAPQVSASAARPFGEAQATGLPDSEDEWRKFDVIVLGDVSPDEIGEENWSIIQRCVNERGALLVMIAGPQFIPHAIESESARNLVPVEMEWGARTYFNSDEKGFKMALTSEGERHPVTQQTNGDDSNQVAWSRFPELRWRHPVESLKEGAEVLLVADDRSDGGRAPQGEAGLESALEALTERRQREAKAALLVTRQSGKGKVALLLTDRTWRLREGAGDVHHHRFWGNLMRWGAGPVLRAGGERVRMGTDQLTYTPDDKVGVTVRLRDEAMNPVMVGDLQADILRDGVVIDRVTLAAVESSNGLHEGQAGPFRESGRYEVRVSGGEAGDLMKADKVDVVEAGFRVVGSHGPVEMADTTLNLQLLQTITELSGGKVVQAEQAADLTELFLSSRDEREELRETGLWDHWAVLGLLGLLLAAEWVIRRSGGLP